MDTRLCRHCKQPIHPEARVCQHCRSSQSWWGNNHDPRFMLGWFVLVVAVFVPLAYFGINRTISGDEPAEAPNLVVSDVSTRVATKPEGARIFVLGVACNSSSRDASRIWFRVSIRDGGGKLVDTLLLEDRGLLVPSEKSIPFRISGLLSTGSLDGARTEVAVERAKVANKWD
jgi:hypothetical protein